MMKYIGLFYLLGFAKAICLGLTIILLTLLSNCATAPGLGGGNATDTSTDAGSGEVSPVTSLPLPHLEKIISASPDNSDVVPVVGFENAFSLEDSQSAADYQVAVTTSPLEETTACLEKQSNPWDFIKTAQAESTGSLCDEDSISCCDLENDGSFECYLQLVNSSEDTVYIAIIDSEDNVGEVQTDTVQANFKWTKNAPIDVTTDSTGNIYALTDGIAVKANYDVTNTTWSVDGDYSEAYERFTASGSQITYQNNTVLDDIFGVLNNSDGVGIYDNSGALVGRSTLPDAEEYKVVKTVYNDTFYGYKVKDGGDTENGQVVDACANIDCDDDLDGDATFRFINEVDATGLSHKETIGFDINNSGKGVFVFKDTSGNTHIRYSDNTTMFGGGNAVSGKSSFDFKDIQLYSDTKALLLDATNDMLWTITIDTIGETVTDTLDDSSYGNGIAVGGNPQSLVMDSNKEYAYVLNADDESITVIQLKNSDDSIRQIPRKLGNNKTLSSLITGDKELSLEPVAMTMDEGQLVIASSALKGLVTLGVSQIDHTATEDEDFDGDGFTAEDGDCDDTNSNLNPDTIWYEDDDGDSYGNPNSTKTQCTQPAGYVSDDTDCDDTMSTNSPVGDEASNCADGEDNDCDNLVDGDDTDCGGGGGF